MTGATLSLLPRQPGNSDRYVQHFASRHELSEQDTIEMMAAVELGMDGERLKEHWAA